MKLRRSAMLVLVAMSLGALPMANATRGTDPVSEPTRVAISHLRADPAAFGVTADDVSRLRVLSAHTSPHNGVTHVYLRQQIHGLDVLTGDVTVNVLPDGSILYVGSRLIPNVASRVTGDLRIEAIDAVRVAAAKYGLVPDATLRVSGFGKGPERETLVTAGGISRSDIPARLVYHPAGKALKLGWEIEIEELSAAHWWNTIVNATVPVVIAEYDYVISEDKQAIADAVVRPSGEPNTLGAVADSEGPGSDGAAYRVFAVPYDSPNDGPRTLVKNPSDPLASPFGWHDTNGVAGPEYLITRGNNVHAYADLTAANASLFPAEGTSELAFDFPLDLTERHPIMYRDAAITNLFYWNNIIHDVMDGYGFTSAAGNFQENRYGMGGVGNDPVLAEGQDSSGVQNANFATPAEGNKPRMQMFLWPATSKRAVLDGDLDSGIIIHEYAHGISNRMTGGPYNVSCLRNDEQAGEGWSDFYAIALTAIEADYNVKRGLATYVYGQPNRRNTGLRPSAYDTRFPTPKYNTIKTAAIPHGVGWVWAGMLWDVFWSVTNAHPEGFNEDVYGDWTTGGNNRAIQIVTDGLAAQPCSPGFVDARNAIIASDLALTKVATPSATVGEYHCEIWTAFARHGLGTDASQGSSASVTDGAEGYGVPAGCPGGA